MMTIRTLLATGLFIVACSTHAHAAVPQTISYQGYLKDANGPVSNQVTLTFRLYDSLAASSPIWAETLNVTPQNGIYTVQLGSDASLANTLDSGPGLYLGIQVGTEQEMSPRQQLNSVPYALRAELPTSTTLSNPTNGFEITNSDTGPAIKGTGGNGNYGTLGGQNGVAGSSVTSGSAILGISTGAGSAIEGYSSGTGRAGFFNIVNDQNNSTALTAQTNGSGDAIQGATTGNGSVIWARALGAGKGGLFTIENAANSNPAILASTNGIGAAGEFFINNPTNGSNALWVTNYGTGNAIESVSRGSRGHAGNFVLIDASNNYSAISGYSSGSGATVKGQNAGTGPAALFTIEQSTNSSSTLDVSNSSSGRAGFFNILNATNSNSALAAQTVGSGDAIQGSSSGSGTAVWGRSLGSGRGGMFTVENAATGNPALQVQTAGIGSAGFFISSNPASNASTIYSSSQGGKALEAVQNGNGYSAYFQSNAAANPSSVIFVDAQNAGAGISVNASGTGPAASFNQQNSASTGETFYVSSVGSGPVISVYSHGTGAAGDFNVVNAASSKSALKATSNGTGPTFAVVNTGVGPAADFRNENTASNYYPAVSINQKGTFDALYVMTNGNNGNAGTFTIRNVSNPAQAILGHTMGNGSAIKGINTGNGYGGEFYIENANSNQDTVISYNLGLGKAGSFIIQNGLNTATALSATTNGTGGAFIGTSVSGVAINGVSDSGYGVQGISTGSVGVVGTSTNDTGVWGISNKADGVGVDGLATGASATGVVGRGGNIGVHAYNYSTNYTADLATKTHAGYFNGPVHSTSTITETSDLRLKTDIQTLEDTLAKVLRLRGVSYVMKADENKERRIGVIAQELEQEYPELVATDDQGMKSVAYANLTAVLIEAVKGQQQTIRTQDERIDSLEKQLANIRTLLGK